MKKVYVFLIAVTAIITLTSPVKTLASSLYNFAGLSGGTYVNGYYTSPPSLIIDIYPSYPAPCVAVGGTSPVGRHTFTLNTITASPNGSYHWQLLEDMNNNALVVKEINENWATDIISCNWNTPNPNYSSIWDSYIKYDTSPPTVSITSPSNNTNLTTTTLTIIGSATDIASGVASVTVNGVVASVNGSTFNATIPLEKGLNTITATATDNVGKSATSNSITVLTTAVTETAQKNKPSSTSGGSSTASSNDLDQAHNPSSSNFEKSSLSNSIQKKIRYRYKPILYAISYIYKVPEPALEQVIKLSHSMGYMIAK